jgi:hypothetical protein
MAGDVSSQVILERHKKAKLDWYRLAKMGFIGAFYIAPLYHFWWGRGIGYCLQNLLPRALASAVGKNPHLGAVVSTTLDQLTVSLAGNAVLFFLICYFDNFEARTSWKNVREGFWSMQFNSWKVWPLATFINFYAVPPLYRVLFANIVAFFWCIYLSFFTNEEAKSL